ncbi:MAG: hypothetical protein RL347_107 [Actinomycetota bacterium]|jgi:bifunctional DNA-binding transcriptional regulator/antitoxin component of YhaV-PrlF toxin-antitoxin module
MAASTAHPLALGDRGRLVIPQEVRAGHGWEQGTELIAIDTEAGVVLMSVEQGLEWLRSRLDGRDLVAELLAERRDEVARQGPTEAALPTRRAESRS